MKHQRANKTLRRSPSHRLALLRTLTSQLLTHGSITTTDAKARALRRFFEPLVTKAKGEMTLHRRRVLLSRLRTKEDLPRLVEIAGRHQTRPGGYIRLTKLPQERADGALLIRVDILP